MTVVDLVRLLRRSWLYLVVGLLVGSALALAYSFTRPTVYEAQAQGVVVAGSTISVGDTMSGDTVTVGRAQTYAALAGTQPVVSRAQQILSAQGRAANGSATAAASGGSPFVTVTAGASTARDAQAMANATLEALRVEALRLETFGRTRGAETSVAQMQTMTSINMLPYQSASVPGAPVRSGLLRNVVAGGALGLLLGGLFAVGRKAFDAKVRSQAQVEELTGRSVLGAVPETKQLKKRAGQGEVRLTGSAAEALRQLRTNLRFVSVDEPPRSVVVTSPTPGDGKSTVATQLARLLAAAGQRVVLVDCDLRRPTQGDSFGLDSGVGVSQVLAGDVPLADAVQESGTPGLLILPAGRIPPNPSELLGSKAMSGLIEQLSASHMVIIDAPPVLAVTDGALLGAAADGTLLVVRTGVTHRGQLEQCAQMLEQARARLLGVVLNATSKRTMGDAYGAGNYGYYGAYYSSTTSAADDDAAHTETRGGRRARARR